ncbi:MAG: stress responsive alpha-beta barrel domain protein [Roseibacillus sp.]|nr:stress responsive alpha-beta barrel domain protein [Roseibacillus sp.]|tara:strand:- start:123 stop:509 length:387 start_codon:yes stop_codon:yes gene_type:complete
MKIILLVLSLSLAFMSSQSFADHHKKQPGAYRHVVCFKFKDDATGNQITAIEKAFAALPSKISSITDYEWGTNVSPENLAQGYTHCFIVSFKDKKGLEAYLPHKDHKAFVEQLLPILDKAFVIDFVAK